jgi:hypothetical protein
VADNKPSEIRQSAWEYVQKLTLAHEEQVPHMYNTQSHKKGSQPDVTCGIGIHLPDPEFCLRPEIREMFYDPGPPSKAPTDRQLINDWFLAHDNILGRAENYAEYCVLRMDEDKVRAHMPVTLAEKLGGLLRNRKSFHGAFEQFETFPACAQVACLSFAYTRLPHSHPLMCKAIAQWYFDDAATLCSIDHLAEPKNRAHKILFLNAVSVIVKKLPYDRLPLGTKPPEEL